MAGIGALGLEIGYNVNSERWSRRKCNEFTGGGLVALTGDLLSALF